MIKKFETFDTISILDASSRTVDTQYVGHKGHLERVEVTETSGQVRSKVVYGRFQLPEIGKCFSLLAEPFDKSLSPELGFRNINTSQVTKVERNGDVILFETLNSKYRLILE